MEMPLPEIIDRLTIVRLKLERIGDRSLEKELAAYQAAVREYESRGIVVMDEWVDRLYELNGQIWDLEYDIRRGKEAELGLEEVGKRAIAIRELNKKRVAIKNEIVEKTGSGFVDVKMNHASA